VCRTARRSWGSAGRQLIPRDTSDEPARPQLEPEGYDIIVCNPPYRSEAQPSKELLAGWEGCTGGNRKDDEIARTARRWDLASPVSSATSPVP